MIAIVLCSLLVVCAALAAWKMGYFNPGNAAKYSVKNIQTSVQADSPLNGKTIIFLGSSVTAGSNAKGESFVDFRAAIDGVIPVEEAVSGTTLVTTEDNSYIERMKTIDPSIRADAFVCQLSTNDATKGEPLGSVSDGTDLADFDTSTVAGAIEYIVCYAGQTWDCPVIFYTGTKYDSEAYGEMIELLYQIQQKWDIGIIDLWNDADMNAVSADDYALYMANGIHPTRAGYQLWWTPKFEAYLSKALS